jgi:hypothetical protein
MTAKLLFSFLVGVSLFGLILGYSGIARLKHAGVPPFNTGLYTAVYSISPPPGNVLRAWDSTPGRILLVCLSVAAPLACAAAVYRFEWRVVGFLGLFLWAAFTGTVGIWTWIFSLFSGRSG